MTDVDLNNLHAKLLKAKELKSAIKELKEKLSWLSNRQLKSVSLLDANCENQYTDDPFITEPIQKEIIGVYKNLIEDFQAEFENL